MILASLTGALVLQALLWLIILGPLIMIIVVLRKNSINNKSKIFWVALFLILSYLALIIYVLVPNKNILT